MGQTGLDEITVTKVNVGALELKPTQRQVLSADGAITIKNGVVVITKGSACAATLANPTAGDDDYNQLEIVAASAFAHTISNAAGAGFNGGGAGSDIATLTAAKGNTLRLRAYQGVWYVTGSINATLA